VVTVSAHGDAELAVLVATAPDLLRYLRRRAPEDAADLLGEVMLVAWRRAGELPEAPEEARLWLFGVARLALRNAARSRSRRLRLADALRARLATEAPVAPDPADDAGAEVRDAISRLPDDLAELVRLVHWDGFSLAESAQILDLNPSTVRSRYARARAELRRSLSLPAEPMANGTPPACDASGTGVGAGAAPVGLAERSGPALAVESVRPNLG
jgi:RNA polymerase sigma factor (sigma-70 family)